RSRAWLAGVIGSAANFGYMIIAVASLGLSAIIGDLGQFLITIGVPSELKERLVSHDGWRLLMLFGAMPAILTFLIRLFVPESHRWEEEKKSGATSHWETRDLLGVLIGATVACGMIALLAAEVHWALKISGTLVGFFIVAAGYLFPIRRYLHRLGSTAGTITAFRSRDNVLTLRRMFMGAAISGIALLGTWGTTQQAPTWVSGLPNGNRTEARAMTQMMGACGAIIGCVLAALAGEYFGRRKTYFFLCVVSMLSIFALFGLNKEYGPTLLMWAFISGMLTASFYGWLPLYLPELFRTGVRATGQGFSFNFGRVLAAIGVMQLPVIMTELKVGFDKACPAISLIYLVGMVLIWFAPETKGKPLPDDVTEE
ncbi:MAG: MFS transporter, partial [Planctomycetes bacterium]|nr:MFS transporter [Planctomycetota bacterium]